MKVVVHVGDGDGESLRRRRRWSPAVGARAALAAAVPAANGPFPSAVPAPALTAADDPCQKHRQGFGAPGPCVQASSQMHVHTRSYLSLQHV